MSVVNDNATRRSDRLAANDLAAVGDESMVIGCRATIARSTRNRLLTVSVLQAIRQDLIARPQLRFIVDMSIKNGRSGRNSFSTADYLQGVRNKPKIN